MYIYLVEHCHAVSAGYSYIIVTYTRGCSQFFNEVRGRNKATRGVATVNAEGVA